MQREGDYLSETIKQLEAEITKLRAKHDALATSMNAIHDPFIHKLPPEIGSHIFRLSLPKIDSRVPWEKGSELMAGALRLGAVCRKWRQLAWATPNLWEILYVSIQPSTSLFLAESLPGLLREWLRRSGMLPLTITFYYSDSEETYSEYEFSDDDPRATIDTLENTKTLVIEILNLHSGRWRKLHLNTGAEIFQCFSGSAQPKQLVDLELTFDRSVGLPGLTPQFKMNSDPEPTRLTVTSFPLTSINICWESLTHATVCRMKTKEGIELLRLAPSLEYYSFSVYSNDSPEFDVGTPILHPRLHSLHLSSFNVHTFLGAVTLPSLEEWTQNLWGRLVPLTTALSFLERSRCCLKVLELEGIPGPSDLNTLLEAIPSLERLRLSFTSGSSDSIIMDGILARIFCSAPATGNTLVADTTTESLLPFLQFMECRLNDLLADSSVTLLSWDRIPQLYRQGHRQSLIFKSAAQRSHITYETVFQLLKLVDEGFDLQIADKTSGGDFLENFRSRMHERGL